MSTRHPVLGRLRGHVAPPDAVLDRLHTINPDFRVGWLPYVDASPTYTGCWGLYLDQRWWAWREMAYQRMKLYSDYRHAGKVDAPMWWDLEAQLDGHVLVAQFPDLSFGSEGFFHHLQRAEARKAARRHESATQDRERQRLRRIATQGRHLLQQGVNAGNEQVLDALRRLYPAEAAEAEALGRELAPFARNQVNVRQPGRRSA